MSHGQLRTEGLLHRWGHAADERGSAPSVGQTVLATGAFASAARPLAVLLVVRCPRVGAGTPGVRCGCVGCLPWSRCARIGAPGAGDSGSELVRGRVHGEEAGNDGRRG